MPSTTETHEETVNTRAGRERGERGDRDREHQGPPNLELIDDADLVKKGKKPTGTRG